MQSYKMVKLTHEKFCHHHLVYVTYIIHLSDQIFQLQQIIERTPASGWQDTEFFSCGKKSSFLFGPQILSSRLYQLSSTEVITSYKATSSSRTSYVINLMHTEYLLLIGTLHLKFEACGFCRILNWPRLW